MRNNPKDINQLENIEIKLLLDGIHKHYGYDFRDYRFSTIRRRIRHRVLAERLSSISALQEKVLHDPECMKRLLSDFTIDVTEMFRDPGFFHSLRAKVIPCLKKYSFIRIWHAGCSSGEEVYSMAILLHEEGLSEKTIIYATDVNEDSLKTAKAGVFPSKMIKTYRSNYLQAGGTKTFSEYYHVSGQSAVFHEKLKKNMVFAQHNLVTDGSFNEFHLTICRNVMIYFNGSLQNRVHRLIYNSLAPQGFLAIGRKEAIKFTEYEQLYEEIDAQEKIFRKL